jgi:hypothetical protein
MGVKPDTWEQEDVLTWLYCIIILVFLLCSSIHCAKRLGEHGMCTMTAKVVEYAKKKLESWLHNILS